MFSIAFYSEGVHVAVPHPHGASGHSGNILWPDHVHAHVWERSVQSDHRSDFRNHLRVRRCSALAAAWRFSGLHPSLCSTSQHWENPSMALAEYADLLTLQPHLLHHHQCVTQHRRPQTGHAHQWFYCFNAN